jgi:SpoVK/Ycf46/Vps4 family AAA+-type ATPase
MQERKGQVFVIATSNDVSKLPPELLRKGRWDDLFFVDLPTRKERFEILKVVITKYKRDPDSINLDAVVKATAGFTGAEIDALMPEALFKAFADNQRALLTEDLLVSAAATVPLSRTAADKIDDLRKWAKGKTRPASLPEMEDTKRENRNLDM